MMSRTVGAPGSAVAGPGLQHETGPGAIVGTGLLPKAIDPFVYRMTIKYGDTHFTASGGAG